MEGANFGLNLRWKPYLNSLQQLDDYYSTPELFMGGTECRVFWTELQLLADGSVTGAQRCFPLELGNLNEKSFHEIWNSEKMREWRMFLKKERALPACSRCCSIL